MNARTKTIFAEPNFAKCADHECDVSDNWIDEVDLENEAGAEVTAFFDETDGFYGLTGLRIIEGRGAFITTWHDRNDALKLLTPETVKRIEDITTDEAHAI